jgi:hypothetical protein
MNHRERLEKLDRLLEMCAVRGAHTSTASHDTKHYAEAARVIVEAIAALEYLEMERARQVNEKRDKEGDAA